jgi:chemotaxis protein MotA
MTTIFIGLVGLVIEFFFAQNGGSLSLYWQWRSFMVVGVGTFSILFLIFPRALFKSLIRSLRGLANDKTDLQQHFPELRALAKSKHTKIKMHHPLLAYAQQLWEQGVNPDFFIVLLSEKQQEVESIGLDVIHGLRNLAKYPPALGMLGTVMGMIDLFSNLDNNKGQIGHDLSMAMTATLLGIILSNMVISPIADRLHSLHMKEQRLNISIYELLLMINSNQSVVLIEEEIKGRAA